MTTQEKVSKALDFAKSQGSATGQSDDGKGSKFLSFFLGEEEYGLQILSVREIIGLMDITQVPQTPHYIRGVINLRGRVIPVLELRTKFGMETVEDTEKTCIIVVEVVMHDSPIQMGILVDSVSEVLEIKVSDIEAAPSFGGGINTDFIMGMGKVKDEVKILLDIDKVLGEVDVSGLGDLKQTAVADSKQTAEGDSKQTAEPVPA
ncbi:MAG: chemotaxis protein CheW [candidate division Zixibacteria bacterium]|nr:chemotaxis protein CheW [candidate division Zixibacteria bacterium]